ncbi:MAG: serine O-acetyltransferase [Lachnospiraceae bacterium]|nr:serine O-acetyltransferase [Lachnospiraceae bacterium]
MGLIKDLKEEYEIFKERDPAIRSYWDVLLYPCFTAKRMHKKAHKLWAQGHYFRARRISQKAVRKTGIEIHPGAQIGKGLFIDHGCGVVIGETTVIGENVTLYQGVTLGGTGKETGKRHPTLGDNVMVSAGAKVIGSFTVGENSKIGAGSVVLEEVPPNCTVVGVPGRVVRRANVVVPRMNMDQCHLPDPVEEDIRTLQQENSALVNRVLELESELKECQKGCREKKNETL